jgi:shikimate kinase/3-dehydroquinate synthase
MGAGKSRAARAARAAGLDVHDTDELLAAELGTGIDEFFAARGEGEFRRREEALATAVLERADGAVVALGGGAVLSGKVRAALERHVAVWLQVDARTAWRRCEGKRPLANDRDRFESLLAERTPLYAGLADAVVLQGDGGFDRALPFLQALGELPGGTRLAWARSASGEYPAFVGRGLLGEGPLGAAARHGEIGVGGRPFCITDSNVGPLYAERLGETGAYIEVNAGEEAKTLGEAERVLSELAEAGMTRSDHVVALGGGVVGDLAGFCAATYQRGVGVVQVPTSLVAQVDSAYGGKTGVDLPEGKNYVGAYHQPAAVIADTTALETLPEAELAAGFVEVVKTALIAGGELWERVRAMDGLDREGLEGVIFECALTKLSIVAADERDAGRRQALNLGHTVGHGIEAATGYARYRHGEAVGLGLLAALRLSGADGLRGEVEALLARSGLPTRLDPQVATDAVLDAVSRDKKRTSGGLGFVLCREPGQVTTGEAVAADSLHAAVEELR